MNVPSEQCLTGYQLTQIMHITIKSPEEQLKMREAGRLAAEVLDMIGPHVVPGVTTEELDRLCYEHIVNVQGTIPANLNYRGFPKTICSSVNHVVCHGIPNDRKLKSGDIINIDVTVIKDGFHGDTSRMYYVGKPPVAAQRLTEVCFEAMWRGIRTVKPGTRLGDIGHAIQEYVGIPEFLGGSRVLRPRHRTHLPRGSADPALWRARDRPGAAAGNDLYSGTHGQRRQTSCAPAAGRLDRGDQGPLAVGPVGAHLPGHGDRRGCPDPGRGGPALSEPLEELLPEAVTGPPGRCSRACRRLLRPNPGSREEYRSLLGQAHEELKARFLAEEPVEILVHARATLIDTVLRQAWFEHLGSGDRHWALVAVGGYGRGELHPCSDIDILLLVPQPPEDAERSQVERLITFLWDIGLEVGHSVRTVAECVQESAPM